MLPDVNAKELRVKLGSHKGFVWVKRAVTPEGAGGDLPPRPARHRLPAGEQARLSQRPTRRPRARLRQPRRHRHLRPGEIHRRPGPVRPARRRLQAGGGRPQAAHHLARPARHLCRARRARQGRGEVQGQGRRRRHPRRQHRRDRRHGLAARLRPQHARRRARPQPHQPPVRRRLRDGLDLQGDLHRDGAGGQQGQLELEARRAREPALRPFHDPRLPRRAPHAHRARGVHPLLQHRHRPHGDDGGRGRAQGVSAQDGAAHPPAHGAAGERRAAGAQELERAQHHHHRLRPGSQRSAAAGADGGGRPRQRRPAHHPDLPEAQTRPRPAAARRG